MDVELIKLLGGRFALILRVKFFKKNYLKYISHLDLLRLFERTFRIVGIPIEYSYGFNPRPRFSFASPLALGVEGYGEYMEISLTEKIDIDNFIKEMNGELPEDIQIIDCMYVEDEKAIGHYIHWADYSFEFYIDRILTREELEESIEDFLNSTSIMIKREKKKKRRTIEWEENIIALIDYIELDNIEKNKLLLRARLKTGEGNLRPGDFLKVFLDSLGINLVDDGVRIKRLELLGEENGKIYKIF